MHYEPPPAAELRRLRDELGFKNPEMADMFGIATGRQFHKYLSEKEQDKREMGFHVLMYGMLQLALRRGIKVRNVEQLHELARSFGAVIELEPVGD